MRSPTSPTSSALPISRRPCTSFTVHHHAFANAHTINSVSTLVILAVIDGDEKPSFDSVLKGQIKSLRDQLDRDTLMYPSGSPSRSSGSSVAGIGSPRSAQQSRAFDTLRSRLPGAGRIWDTSDNNTRLTMPGALPQGQGSGVNVNDVKPVVMGGRSFIF